MTMTNSTLSLSLRRLLEIAGGYRAMLARPFPSATSRQRAAFHYAMLKPAMESYDEGVKPLADREAKIPELPVAEQATERAAISAELHALLAEMIEVPRPTKMLVEADLPREKGGEDANGLVTLALAPEFFTLADPDVSPED